MNDLIVSKKDQKHENLVKYLKESKYVDVPEVHVNLLIAYCEAASLDPLADVAHIVPFNKNVGDGKNPKWVKSYQIFPGIAKFRIQGSRTGRCVGVEVPEYGPMITETIGDVEVTYPEWCIVTVKMLVKGNIAEFKGIEFWKEAYAQTSKNNIAPREIWLKRPRGQLAKCAEAQAWRKAAPELFGGEVTFEEIDGKYLEEPFIIDNNFSERQSNVVDRIKKKSKQKSLEKIEPVNIVPEIIEEPRYGKLEEAIEKMSPESESKLAEEVEKPSDAIRIFNKIRYAKPAIADRVEEYLQRSGPEISDKKAKSILKNILKIFPEVQRQLSDNDKEALNKICEEE